MRNQIVSEIWKRLYDVFGVKRVVRNPSAPSGLSDHPAIHIIELADNVIQTTKRGQTAIYRRNLQLVLEVFVIGDTEDSASKDLLSLVSDIRAALLSDGENLGGICAIRETDTTGIAVVKAAQALRGIGLKYSIDYIEEIGG